MKKPVSDKRDLRLVLWIMVLTAAFALGGGMRAVGDAMFGSPPSKSVFEEQYEAAKRSSDIESMCFQAGMIAKQYLDERDLEKYQLWKAIEFEDCNYARPVK